MHCLELSEIEGYISGSLDERVCQDITSHLDACTCCRKAIAAARGETGVAGETPATNPPRRKKPLLKVRCTVCGAQYGISPERVVGRVVKIRCKACQSIFEVRSAATTEKSVLERGRRLWFLVIRRQRVGPMTEQEVRERFQRGEIKARTYAWRQGFPRWERLNNVPEFKELAHDSPIATSNQLAGRSKHSSALQREVSDPVQPDDVPHVESSAVARPRPHDMGEIAPARENLADERLPRIHCKETDRNEILSKRKRRKAHQVGDNLAPGELDRDLKAQRRDNSVLFSLSHLQELAAPPRKEEQPAASGIELFNIRSMPGPPPPLLIPLHDQPPRRLGLGLVLGIGIIGVILGASMLLGIFFLIQPKMVRALFSRTEARTEIKINPKHLQQEETVQEGRARADRDAAASPLLPAP